VGHCIDRVMAAALLREQECRTRTSRPWMTPGNGRVGCWLRVRSKNPAS